MYISTDETITLIPATFSDRGKALKQRLLKEHASKKRKKNTGTSVDYEQCLRDLDCTDSFKALCAADNLRRSFMTGRQTKKTVHHQRVLDKLDTPSQLRDDSYGCIPDLDITPVDDTTYGVFLKDRSSRLSESFYYV